MFHAPGGLSIYWAIMIGVIIMSGYLVGGLIPKRNPPPIKGQALSFRPPAYSQGRPMLQLGSLLIGGCEGLPGVLFLIDTSEAMRRIDGNSGTRKIDVVKTSLLHFASRLTDRAVIGVMTYSDTSNNDPRMRVPLRELGPNRTGFQNGVGELQANGLNYFRSGVEEAKTALAQAQVKYPNHNFNLIIISGGIPQTAECATDPGNASCLCRGNLCFARNQDPATDPNVAKEVQNMRVEVFAIGIGGVTGDEAAFTQEYRTMLAGIASPPLDRHFLITSSVSTMNSVMSQIGSSLCLDDSNAPPLSENAQ